MRLTNKIINKLRGMEAGRQLEVFRTIFGLQMGMMSDAQILETGPIMYLAGFSKMLKGGHTLVFAVVPERVPLVQTILDKTHISGFKFRQYLRIIDIVYTSDKKLAYQSFQAFVQHL